MLVLSCVCVVNKHISHSCLNSIIMIASTLQHNIIVKHRPSQSGAIRNDIILPPVRRVQAVSVEFQLTPATPPTGLTVHDQPTQSIATRLVAMTTVQLFADRSNNDLSVTRYIDRVLYNRGVSRDLSAMTSSLRDKYLTYLVDEVNVHLFDEGVDVYCLRYGTEVFDHVYGHAIDVLIKKTRSALRERTPDITDHQLEFLTAPIRGLCTRNEVHYQIYDINNILHVRRTNSLTEAITACLLDVIDIEDYDAALLKACLNQCISKWSSHHAQM